MKSILDWLISHNIKVNKPELIKQAFIHTSYFYEHPKLVKEDNQRLEFIGDAVLQLWSAHYLYSIEPPLKEGEMTKLRAQLVCEKSLAEMAKQLGLHEFILLGQGELKDRGFEKDSIIADMFESLLGALYLDQGFEPIDTILNHILIDPLSYVNQNKVLDYKTQLQEYVQADNQRSIRYALLNETGAPNEREFEIAVLIDDIQYGKGKGVSKKKAEQAAAKDAIEKMVR